MRIQHNILAMNAYRNYNANTSALAKNLEKLSSGYRINRAGDDAAGLAISEKMRAQITGLNAAQKNVKDGISLVKTAEGAMQEIQDMLNRMDYLATQSANGTYQNEVDRENLQKEVDSLRTEINRIADSSNFNGINLLDGKLGLNEEAFKVLGSVQAAAGADKTSTVITTAMPAAGSTAGTDTILHTDGIEAKAGTFTIDLSQLNAVSKDNTTKAKLTITIGSAKFDIEAANNGDILTGADIAAKLTAEINDTTAAAKKGFVVKADGTTTDNTAVGTAGSIKYKAVNNGDGTITLTTDQVAKGGAWVNLTNGIPNGDVADGALKDPGFNVSVADQTAATCSSLTGNPNIDGTKTQIAQKAAAGQFGNTFLTIDLEKLTDGMQMTIAGETKTIGKGKDIDLSDLDLTQTADKLKAMDRITQAFGDNQHVSVGQDAANPGKLTLSEKVDPATGKSKASADMQEKMSTLDGFKSLVSFKGADQVAGSQVEITSAKVNEGDALTVDGVKYVFTEDLTGKTDDANTKYVQFTKGGSDAAQNFATKVGGTLGDDGKTVTIATAAGKAAPSILGNGLTLQIGDTADAFNQLSVGVGDMHVSAMNSSTGKSIADIDISTQKGAQDAVQVIKDAINYVSSVRGDLGATQNRLEHTQNNLSVMAENIQDAESTIRDTDVAEEMMAYTKNNILVQAAQAMLAQANAVPQGVLQLLQ